MLSDNNIKESLSISYIHAICGMAGFTYGTDSMDYGFDITIKDILKRESGKLCPSGYNLDIQIKATTNFEINDSFVKYRIRNKNYNDLINTEAGTPRILVVLTLPEDKESWLIQDVESLAMKKCAYWICLKGRDSKENEESSTLIEIPKENIFSVENLSKIMDIIKEGGEINDL